MKKIITTSVMICLLITSMASEHFRLNLREQNIQLNEFVSNLQYYCQIPEKSSLLLLDKVTDDLGIEHLRYQQYYNKIKIEHAILQIHAKDNIVQSMSGWVMKSEPELNLNRTLSDKQDENTMYIKVGDKYRIARKLTKGSYYVYIDIETGDELNRIPLFNYANVQGKAETMYSGWQEMTTYEHEGNYYLMDETRGIITLDATGVVRPHAAHPELLPDTIKTAIQENPEMEIEIISDWVKKEGTLYIQSCKPYSNTLNTWNIQQEKLIFSSIVINQILDSEWCGSLDNPDIYIKVYKDSKCVHISQVADDITNKTLPITFAINMNLLDSNYMLEIYDEDLDGDDLAATLSINDFKKSGEYKLKNKNISITVNMQAYANDNMAYDAHWGVQKTYDYFLNTFQRASYDNKNSIIYQLINPEKTSLLGMAEVINNAAAYNKYFYFMYYGRGDGVVYRPLVSLDIIAHEFTHLVTANNRDANEKGLVYQGESGALNESFSDIFATCVENYANDETTDWTIAEDICINIPYTRDMSNPNVSYESGKLNPCPDTYFGEYYVDPTDTEKDQGGVHTNSGVQNFWFYLLCEGGQGFNDRGDAYKVKGIGIKNAEQIAYRNLMHYLPTDATFHDARFGSIEACMDLFPNNQSFVESVINAWYAVGVGEDSVTDVDDINEEGRINVIEGHVCCDEDFKIYDMMGRDVTSLNGTLNGVYIIKIGSSITKVYIK